MRSKTAADNIAVCFYTVVFGLLHTPSSAIHQLFLKLFHLLLLQSNCNFCFPFFRHYSFLKRFLHSRQVDSVRSGETDGKLCSKEVGLRLAFVRVEWLLISACWWNNFDVLPGKENFYLMTSLALLKSFRTFIDSKKFSRKKFRTFELCDRRVPLSIENINSHEQLLAYLSSHSEANLSSIQITVQKLSSSRRILFPFQFSTVDRIFIQRYRNCEELWIVVSEEFLFPWLASHSFLSFYQNEQNYTWKYMKLLHQIFNTVTKSTGQLHPSNKL